MKSLLEQVANNTVASEEALQSATEAIEHAGLHVCKVIREVTCDSWEVRITYV